MRRKMGSFFQLATLSDPARENGFVFSDPPPCPTHPGKMGSFFQPSTSSDHPGKMGSFFQLPTLPDPAGENGFVFSAPPLVRPSRENGFVFSTHHFVRPSQENGLVFSNPLLRPTHPGKMGSFFQTRYSVRPGPGKWVRFFNSPPDPLPRGFPKSPSSKRTPPMSLNPFHQRYHATRASTFGTNPNAGPRTAAGTVA